MITHVWDDHYSLIIIMGCLIHGWTHCMSFLCYGGLRSLFCCSWPLKRHSNTNLYGSIPLQLNITYFWQGWLDVMALVSEVIEEETEMRYSLPSLIWHVLVNSPGPSYKRILTNQLWKCQMRIGFTISGRFTHCTTRFFTFFTFSILGVLFFWLCPRNKVKCRVKTMLIWFNISYSSGCLSGERRSKSPSIEMKCREGITGIDSQRMFVGFWIVCEWSPFLM